MVLEVVEQKSGQIELTEALVAARTDAERSLSGSTRRGYARDLAAFQIRCEACAVTALPAEPQALAAYLEDLALTDRLATNGRSSPRLPSRTATPALSRPARRPRSSALGDRMVADVEKRRCKARGWIRQVSLATACGGNSRRRPRA